ncbi:hypothetical protein ACWEFJ_38085 [Actinosynnema sp. NPDC004786]
MTDIVDDDLAGFWTPPVAHDLPELREELAGQMRNPFELQITTEALKMGRGAIVPPGPPERAAAILLNEEYRRLQAARLFLVTEEMTELARVAGAGLPDFRLKPEDVPCPAGFVQFSSSIGDYHSPLPGGQRQRTHIVACSWGPTEMRTGRDGIWVTFWSPINHSRLAGSLMRQQGLHRAEAERRMWASRGAMAWDNEAWMPYDGTDGITVVTHNHIQDTLTTAHEQRPEGDSSTASWIQTLRAAWLLMTQPGITDVQEKPLSRRQQRRADREGHRTDPIKIVRLRAHPTHPHTPGTDAGGRNAGAYTVRWMVRGHWRQQAHGPGRSQRRPIWINPHVKGPEGAPLNTGDTVYLVDRPGIPQDD